MSVKKSPVSTVLMQFYHLRQPFKLDFTCESTIARATKILPFKMIGFLTFFSAIWLVNLGARVRWLDFSIFSVIWLVGLKYLRAGEDRQLTLAYVRYSFERAIKWRSGLKMLEIVQPIIKRDVSFVRNHLFYAKRIPDW